MTRALLSVALLFCCLASGDPKKKPYQVSKSEYVETRGLSVEILTRFPPSEYHYIFVGRSPVTLAAFVQGLDPTFATNVPGSGFTFINRMLEMDDGKPDVALELMRGKVKHHLSRFLPSPKQLGGKKILVVDYCREGQSLAGFERSISAYYGKEATVEALALTDPTKPDGEKLAAQRKYHAISLKEYPSLRRGFETGQFEDHAEYPQEFYVTRQRSEDLQKGETYPKLVQDLFSRALTDPDPKLQGILDKVPALSCVRPLALVN